jgi:hypothetical protein
MPRSRNHIAADRPSSKTICAIQLQRYFADDKYLIARTTDITGRITRGITERVTIEGVA